jgi:glyoxylase-like metal-dependent hydrolase (beta-lactamase superfamily II)
MTDQTPDVKLGAAPRPPVVSGQPEEIADGVYLVPDGRVPLVPNIGVVVGDHSTLVIDTGLGPRNGALVHDIAEKLADGRRLFLTITHFHPEHGYGAQAFRDSTIVYNRTQRDELREKGPGYLETFRGLGVDVAHELEGVEFVDPHIVYDGAAEIDLGGKTVQLHSWGAAHSRGDQVAFLPAERVLFTGDLVEDRFYPIFPYFPPYDVDVTGDGWLRVLGELARLDPEIVIPGHGEMGGTGLITVTRDYIEFLKSEIARLAGDGAEPGGIIDELEIRLRVIHPDWDASEPWRVATAVQALIAEASS